MRPLPAHRRFWNNPAAKRMIEFMSVLVVGDSVGEGSAELSPDFPAGVIRFLLVYTLPCALGLNGFKVTIVDTRVKLVSLCIGYVGQCAYIQVQATPINPLDLDRLPFGISKDHIHEVLIMMPLKTGNAWVI